MLGCICGVVFCILTIYVWRHLKKHDRLSIIEVRAFFPLGFPALMLLTFVTMVGLNCAPLWFEFYAGFFVARVGIWVKELIVPPNDF